jgi:hypothetical protein
LNLKSIKKTNSYVLFSRIRKLSLGLLGPDEDRALVTFSSQLPDIVIEQPEPSISNGDQQSRRTSINKSNTDIKL